VRHVVKLILENFMSHKKSIINLAGPGQITALTGPSDSGKSASLKAIELLLTGKWDASYLRHGAKNLSVTAEYNDSYALTYKRTKAGSPVYIIRYPDGQEQVFEGFGRTVPAEVVTLTGVSPVVLGDSTFLLNVQRQDAGPFMGSSVSAPGRARILGALAGTEEIDAAARLLSNQLTKDRQERSRLSGDPDKKTIGEIGVLDEQLKAYEYLDSFGENIEQVKEFVDQIQRDQATRDKLVSLWNQIATVRMEANKAEDEWFVANDLIARIEGPLWEMDRDALLLKTLAMYLELAKDIESDLESQGDVIQATATLPEVSELIQGIDRDASSHKALTEKRDRLTEIKAGLEEQDSVIRASKNLPVAATKITRAEQRAATQTTLQALNQALRCTAQDMQKAHEVVSLTGGVDAATAKIQSLVTDSAALVSLLSLDRKMGQTHAALKEVGKIIDVTQRVPDASTIAESTLGDAGLYEKLSALMDRERWNAWEIGEASTVLKETADIANALKLLTEAGASVGVKETYLKLWKARADIEGQMGDVAGLIKVAEQQVSDSEDGYFGLLKEMDICELCGSEVSEEGLRRVV